MDIVPALSADFLMSLLKAEAILTANIIGSLAAGELILASGVLERLFRPVVPALSRRGIDGRIAAAMLIALGSPRSGAALISGAYSDGEMTKGEAAWGTLSLAFPGYLRRWVGTAALAVGTAGAAGLAFALVIITRSACRFAWAVAMLARSSDPGRPVGAAPKAVPHGARERFLRVLRLLRRSLPWAWCFFALTYALVPVVDRFFTDHIAVWGINSFLPAAGWAVAASSIAHVTAALSVAGGALATGELSARQAVLALLVGSLAGSVTRTMRQNVSYWVGIFPKELIPNLLRLHLATTLTLEVLSVFLAWCAAGVSFGG